MVLELLNIELFCQRIFLKSTLDHNPLKDPGVPHFAFDMFRKALDNVVYTFCCFIIFELMGQKLLNLE
jgi:hypothetical protein